MVEITSEQNKEQNKVKRMKRTEDSLRDLWNNIKCTNIHSFIKQHLLNIQSLPDTEIDTGNIKIIKTYICCENLEAT